MQDLHNCPGCGSTLAIPTHLAGLLVQCPACDTQFRPAVRENASMGPVTNKGRGLAEELSDFREAEFWPAPVAEWDNATFRRDTTVARTRLLSRGEIAEWVQAALPADDFVASERVARGENDFQAGMAWSSNDSQAQGNWQAPLVTEALPAQVTPDAAIAGRKTVSAIRPHRAGFLLTLGIIGIIGLGICGTIAWRLADADLKRMNRGEMDPSGRQHTETAYVLGLVGIARTLMELTVLGMVLFARFL